ncbi:hypothetical protein GCM10009801_49960 [Streptomyces albiaxialis]|uniref:Uncharacterized protein n=1 Tax=Streptomyces albiaxialis TaxID=329523 RepID=A0ABN2WBW9_9ACTN
MGTAVATAVEEAAVARVTRETRIAFVTMPTKLGADFPVCLVRRPVEWRAGEQGPSARCSRVPPRGEGWRTGRRIEDGHP